MPIKRLIETFELSACGMDGVEVEFGGYYCFEECGYDLTS